MALPCGRSEQTSAGIVDGIDATGEAMAEQAQTETSLLQITMDHGPAWSGRRPQWLSRMVQLADVLNKPRQRRYSPPYQSQYTPSESCWGLVEWKWHGAKRIDVATRLGWAQAMPWKGLHPVVALRRTVYAKGSALRQMALEAVEARWQRAPPLPQYDIWINPASTS